VSTKRTLSEQVLSATLWNTVLLPMRIVVGIASSVVYYQQLSREQVSVIFLVTSVATTVGMYADLGIERSLPPFLPQVEREAGPTGVSKFLRRVVRWKLLILLALIAALFAAARPLASLLAKRQRTDAERIERQAVETQAHGGTGSEAATLRARAEANREVASQIERQAPLFALVIALLLFFGALFDVDMQVLTAYFKQRAWNLITLTNALLRPILVTGLVVLGFGVGGVLLGLVLSAALAVFLARRQARQAREGAAVGTEPLPLPSGLFSRFARFASVNYLLQITTWLYDLELVVFLAAATLGLREIALLGFAYKFAKDTLGYLWMPLTGVMTPLLARVKGRPQPAALTDAHGSLTRMIWLLLIPAGTGVALLTPRLFQALYPKYEGASTLAVVFLAFGILEAVLAVPHNVLMVHERYRAIVLSRAVTVLSIPLVQVLLPRYGLLGVAVAVGAVRVAASLITMVEGMNLFRLRLPLAFGARVASATLAFVVVLWPLLRNLPAAAAGSGIGDRLLVLGTLTGLSFLGAVVFLAVLRLLGGLEELDRRRLLELRVPGKAILARVL
jgi:O-antigen/teichoic acid export membrane protein